MAIKKFHSWTLLFAVVLALLLSGTAWATVTFYEDCEDPTSSSIPTTWTFHPCGFVGKGDTQTAFVWNNPAMQAHHEHIIFITLEQQILTQGCRAEGGAPPDLTVVGHRTKTKGVGSTVARDDRKREQFVGWNLNSVGPEETSETDWEPVGGGTVGTAGCPEGMIPIGATNVETTAKGLYACDPIDVPEPQCRLLLDLS